MCDNYHTSAHSMLYTADLSATVLLGGTKSDVIIDAAWRIIQRK